MTNKEGREKMETLKERAKKDFIRNQRKINDKKTTKEERQFLIKVNQRYFETKIYKKPTSYCSEILDYLIRIFVGCIVLD